MEEKLRRHWRKSSQWFALTRKHAELVVRDTELLPTFRQHCHSGFDEDLNRCAPLWPVYKHASPHICVQCVLQKCQLCYCSALSMQLTILALIPNCRDRLRNRTHVGRVQP